MKNTGITRIIKAFGYSMEGLTAAFKDEAAFRQECLLAVILLPAAVVFAGDRISMALMIGSVLLVLLVELLNSAVEAAVDRHGSEIHPLAKKAKDVGSAAVFVALANAVITWALCLTA